MAAGDIPPIPSQDELRAKIKELQQKVAKKKGKLVPPAAPKPQASPELWPGGPSVDTGDIALAAAKRVRPKRARRPNAV